MRILQPFALGTLIVALGSSRAALAAACTSTCSTSCPSTSVINVVADCGSTGDGITDDNTCIQDAVSCLSSTRGVLYFPTGTYLTNKITLPPNVTGTVKGDGPVTTILKLNYNRDENLLEVPGYWWVIRDLSLYGNRYKSTNPNGNVAGSGLVLKNARIFVENVDIYQFPDYGIYIIGTAQTNAHGNRMERVHVEECDIGIYGAAYSYDTHLDNITVADCNATEFTGKTGIRIESGAWFGNAVHVWGSGLYGVYIKGDLARFTNFYFEQSAGNPNLYVYQAKGCAFQNGYIKESGSNGISIINSDRTSISNTTVRNNNGYGVYLSNSDFCVITNNQFFDDQGTKEQTYGLYITNGSGSSDHCIVTGNVSRASDHVTGAAAFNNGTHIIQNNIGFEQMWYTLSTNDSTPAVEQGGRYETANTIPTTITDFDGNGKIEGSSINIQVLDNYTTFDFTNSGLLGNGNTDYPASSGDWLECNYDGTKWNCLVGKSG